VDYLLRSWYFAFVGGVINLVLEAIMVISALTSPPGGGLGAVIGIAILLMFGIVLLVLGSISLIIALLLKKERTRKAGAVVSLIAGIIALFTQIGILGGIFLIVASIIYFGRKPKNELEESKALTW